MFNIGTSQNQDNLGYVSWVAVKEQTTDGNTWTDCAMNKKQSSAPSVASGCVNWFSTTKYKNALDTIFCKIPFYHIPVLILSGSCKTKMEKQLLQIACIQVSILEWNRT